jgi:outer membrane protein assembly factor BamB
MVDRHLRTTASLAMGGRLFIPGNDIVIGIDAYNGMELWSAPLPGFTRTGAPYDGGWWAVGPTGVFAAVGDEARVIDPRDGAIVDTFEVPPRASASCGAIGDPSPRCEWSWLALEGTQLLGSAALPGTSHLDQSRASIVDQYSDSQPLATSRALFSIDLPTGRTNWVHGDGLIVNPTISVRDGRIVFVESRSEPALADLDGRVTLKDLRRGPLDLVAIDSRTGRRLWRVPLDGTRFDHSLFVALAPEQVILTGSSNGEQSVQYHVAAHDPVTGKELWRAQHPNDREGINGSHGEQVHHPVLLDGVLIAEPHAYELATGKLIDPTNSDGFYLRSRSGCGTISASRNCLFYRDKNPTVLDLTSGTTQQNKLTHASRPGCWVNVIPAQGMALIPESSSGCVCGYSLQTSLGLFPLDSRD